MAVRARGMGGRGGLLFILLILPQHTLGLGDQGLGVGSTLNGCFSVSASTMVAVNRHKRGGKYERKEGRRKLFDHWPMTQILTTWGWNDGWLPFGRIPAILRNTCHEKKFRTLVGIVVPCARMACDAPSQLASVDRNDRIEWFPMALRGV